MPYGDVRGGSGGNRCLLAASLSAVAPTAAPNIPALLKSAPASHPVQGNSCYCNNRGLRSREVPEAERKEYGTDICLSFLPVPGDLGSTGPDNDSQKLILQTFQRDFL